MRSNFWEIRVASVIFFVVLLQVAAAGECGMRTAPDMRNRVLDLLFRSEHESATYLSKITLRYGDSDSQLVVMIHPVYPVNPYGRTEVISYTVNGMGNDGVSGFISKMTEKKPRISDQEIAAKLTVATKRSPISYEDLSPWLEELKSIRISPMFGSRVAVDEYSDYEFCYDGGQESVGYKLVGPFKDDPQDRLVQWMIKFRANLPELLKASIKP